MDRLDLLASPGLREMLLHVRGSARPVSVDDAAAALGVHRTAARARLERLRQAGLVECTFARRSGRSGPGAGRPAKLYSAAPESEVLEFPARHLAVLVARLLDEVPAERREEALRRAGEDFGRELACAAALRPRLRIADGLERVCAAIRSLGFQASLDRIEDKMAVIRTPTCPLRPLVAERGEAVHIDRGMWAGMVERGLRGVRAEAVDCETHACLDGSEACSVVIQLRHVHPRSLRS